MRYSLVSSCLFFSGLFASSPLQAFQLQLRAFQTQANMSYLNSEVPTVWNGAYLQGAAQTTIDTRAPNKTVLNSLGYELTLGAELFYPYVYVDAGISQAHYYPGPGQKIEDLTPKAGLQVVTNVQDRWMPFARIGLSQHRLKLIANRVETRRLPPALGLTATQDRFWVSREWLDHPHVWNGDLSLGCKLYPYPTSAIIVEYRFSRSLAGTNIREREAGTSSFADDAGFSSENEISGFRLTSQEFSLALETEL